LVSVSVCAGLEDQLLVDVIKNERPDLEDKKDALVVSIASDQKALKVRLLTHSLTSC
jgi:hypothetical protein